MDLMSDLIWKSWKLSTVWAILFNISCAVWEWPLFELGPFLLRINEPFCHICVKSFELQPCLDHWPLLMKAALLVLFLCSKVASKSSSNQKTKGQSDQGRNRKCFLVKWHCCKLNMQKKTETEKSDLENGKNSLESKITNFQIKKRIFSVDISYHFTLT